MLKFTCLLTFLLMLQVSRACNGQNEEEQLAAARQQSDEYFSSAYGYTYNPNPWGSAYYQPSARVPGYVGPYERRTAFNTPTNNNFASNNADNESNQPESRFALGGLGANLINTGLFNNRFTPANTWRPFASLANRIPVSVNPDFSSPLANFDACTSPSGDAGICAPGSVCSLFGGRPSGSCILGKVCCINAITTCGGTVTLNNTYWQSPTTGISAPSTCALTVRMDTKLVEQLAKPICQIRLDFVSFTTAQPTLGTCTDSFMVGGATTTAPIICGDNAGQHMYLDVPSSAITPTDVQLMFNFAAGPATRSWNIKIALLPCGASYLAPTDCLQYFSSATGRVRSFNWQDVAGSAAPRQLNNQNYNICFRTELVAFQRATQMCVSTCQVSNGGNSFFITTVAKDPNEPNPPANALVTAAAQDAFAATYSSVGSTFVAPIVAPALVGVTTASCLYDFLLIAGAHDTNGVEADRYCGGALNPAALGSAVVPNAPLTLAVLGGGVPASVQVCTPVRPFKMTYRTNGNELAIAAGNLNPPTIPVQAGADAGIAGVNGNTGFCLNYQEQ